MSEQLPAAQLAYQAYGSATGHKNFRGDPMPAWADLPDTIRHAWTVAADAILAMPSIQPEYGEIQISRHLGRGIVVDTAPEHAKAYLGILASAGNGVSVEGGAIRIADQVLYEITGYDPADCTLTLQLVHDWRPGHTDDPNSVTRDPGEAARRAAGIDGTAGDAQDISHGFVRDNETGACLVCGLAKPYRKHLDDDVQQGDPQSPTPPCPVCSHPMADHSVYKPPLRPRPTWCHACDTHCGHNADVEESRG